MSGIKKNELGHCEYFSSSQHSIYAAHEKFEEKGSRPFPHFDLYRKGHVIGDCNNIGLFRTKRFLYENFGCSVELKYSVTFWLGFGFDRQKVFKYRLKNRCPSAQA